jgi:hypothetical protein
LLQSQLMIRKDCNAVDRRGTITTEFPHLFRIPSGAPAARRRWSAARRCSSASRLFRWG